MIADVPNWKRAAPDSTIVVTGSYIDPTANTVEGDQVARIRGYYDMLTLSRQLA
jgi:hypothetical protein